MRWQLGGGRGAAAGGTMECMKLKLDKVCVLSPTVVPMPCRSSAESANPPPLRRGRSRTTTMGSVKSSIRENSGAATPAVAVRERDKKADDGGWQKKIQR